MSTARLEELVPAFIPMGEFIRRYLTVEPGQHITLIGPNGCGKTTVGLNILAQLHTDHPTTRGVALVMKPDKGPRSEGRRATGDRTVTRLTKQLGGKVTRNWPPFKLWWADEPAFWAYWPRHTMDPDVDDEVHYHLFREVILGSYRTGDCWVFADEARGLTVDLQLKRELATVLSRGRSMNAGAIMASQAPRWNPTEMYSEAKHFFLWKMADGAIYERLREIGGHADPKVIERILRGLRNKFECLYLQPDENVMAVLTSDRGKGGNDHAQ